MKLVLYGPPGIGKTTLIQGLKAAGYPAYDLEDLPDTPSRELALEMADNCFLGGADTRPSPSPTRVNVLLTLDEDEYHARRDARDQLQPEKAAQDAQTFQTWMDYEWNAIIPADDEAPAHLIELLDYPGIIVPPKAQKTQDNWTITVRGHADAVSALMSWAALRLTIAGQRHDQDKISGPNPKHGEQRHHWYRTDHTADDPDMFDLFESACDTIATTLGRWRADPWNFALWSPPKQTVPWWEAVYGRTLARLWQATDAPALFEDLPGCPDLSPTTNKAGDDRCCPPSC